MLLRWRDIQSQQNGVHLHDTIDLLQLVKEDRQLVALGPLQVELDARVVSDTLMVDGNLKGPVTYKCSRCLTNFDDEISTSFTLQFVRGQLDESNEEDERIPVTEDTIDLDSYLEQEVLLAMPYVPVCKGSCAGLCPVCGKNRNEQVCNCNTESIDPRLADLAKLLKSE